MRSCFLALMLCACGRLDFNALSDAGASDGDDARPQAIGPVAVAYTASNSCAPCSTLSIPVTPPDPDDPLFRRIALVTFAAGRGPASPGPSPLGMSASYGNVPMNGAMRVVNPNAMYQPVVELFQLLDPPLGSAMVTLTLTGQADTLDVGIVVVDGINPALPIRSFGAGTGTSMMTLSTVTSGDDDVVIDIVCAGNSIDAMPSGNSQLVMEGFGNVSSCGNLQVGGHTGVMPNLTTAWTVNTSSTDLWIQLQASLQPPP